MKEKETDYESKAKFLKAFESWRKEQCLKHDHITQSLDMKSRGTYAIWLKPYTPDKPSIKLINIAKMSKMSGIPFMSKLPTEQEVYLQVFKECGGCSVGGCEVDPL